MKAKVFCFLVAILFALTSVAYAQVREYPKKSIQIVAGHAAGSSVDIFYRLLAEETSKMWKVPVNVFNKPTASGSVAASEVANAEKDGYTLLAALVGTLATVSVGNPKSPVHILRDFDPLEIHTYGANVIWTRADSQFKSLDDVVEYARKKPGDIICGVSEMGSTSHLLTLQLKRLANVDITIVHNDGPPQVLTGVLGGHFNQGWGNHAMITPLVTAGRIRALASDMKCPLGVPTFAEKGYPVSLPLLMGLMGPKGLPPAAVRAWDDAVNAIMKDPKFQASINKAGFLVTMTTGTEKLNGILKEEVARYSKFTPEELGWKQK